MPYTTVIQDGVEHTFIRVRSHRASAKLKRLFACDKLDWHFNMYDGGGFVLIPADRLRDARTIAGVTHARPTHPLYRCFG